MGNLNSFLKTFHFLGIKKLRNIDKSTFLNFKSNKKSTVGGSDPHPLNRM